MEATTDQLSGFPAPLLEGIDVQRFDRSYGSHAVAAIFVPIVHKTSLNEQLADKSVTNPFIVKQLLF